MLRFPINNNDSHGIAIIDRLNPKCFLDIISELTSMYFNLVLLIVSSYYKKTRLLSNQFLFSSLHFLVKMFGDELQHDKLNASDFQK